MKNAMKKLMSLVLVAVLLVSAVPFAASADEALFEVPVKDVQGRTLGSVRYPIDADGKFTIPADYATNVAMVAGYDTASADIALYSNKLSDAEDYKVQNIAGTRSATDWKGHFLVSAKPMGEGDKGTVEIDQNVTHSVKFVDSQFKTVATYIVNDGETLANADLSKIKNPTVPSGFKFAGWRDINSNNQFLTNAPINANTTYMMVLEEVQISDNTGSSGSGSTGSGSTGSGSTGSGSTGSGSTGSQSTKYKVTFTDNMNAVLYAFEVEAGKYLSADQVNMVAADAAKSGYTLKWVSGDQAYYTSALTTVAINGATTFRANYTANNLKDNGAVDEEWMKDIYLYIYTNNDIISPAKRVLLNNYTIVNDHKLSKDEILTVVDDYYKASNSNNGIIWKGAYQETNNITALDFVAGKDDTNDGKAYIDNLDIERSSNNVIIKVRVTGVTTVSSTTYTADSSNPKTGDEIYMAVTVLGLSAASLAAVAYVYSKKRLAK